MIRRASFFVALAGLCLAVGCGREEAALPEVPVSRTADPAFRKDVARQVAGQNRTAARLAEVREKMAAIRARTKNPEKDPEWQELEKKRVLYTDEMAEQLKGTRASARAALMQEAADKAAVRQGKARYAAPQQPAGSGK